MMLSKKSSSSQTTKYQLRLLASSSVLISLPGRYLLFRVDGGRLTRTRINIDKLTYAQFLSAVKSAREEFTFTRESSVETLSWEKSDGSGAGSVAQVGKFLQVNKQTGETSRVTSVTVATVGIENGQRVLLELAEISKED